MTMTLVETIEVGSGGIGTIEFASIPQTGTDLVVMFSLRTNRTQDQQDLQNFYLNNNGASYTVKRLYGNGVSVVSSSPSYLNPLADGANNTTSTFSNGQIYIPNYTSANYKSASADMVTEQNGFGAEPWIAIYAINWANTAAVTSLQIAGAGGTFQQYSTASLYTITKGSGGATVS